MSVGTTLALKLHRVEQGFYSDQLEKLFLEYLEKSFLNPYAGKPIKYESDGKNFTLSLLDGNGEQIQRLTSEARY